MKIELLVVSSDAENRVALARFARSPTGKAGTFKIKKMTKRYLKDYTTSQKTEVLYEKLKTVLPNVISKIIISTDNFTKFL